VTTLASRDVIAKTPLPGEVTRCPAGILGDSRDSEPGPGLDGMAKLGVSSPSHEQFPRQSREGTLESRSRLIMGDFFSVCKVSISVGV